MAIATIQHRRGQFAEFDKTKMLPAEFAVILSGDPDVPSGKALYLAFASGDVHRLISIEDLEDMVRQEVFKGEKGDPGVSVTDADIDDRGHLMISLSDGTQRDAGFIDDALELIQQAVDSAAAAKQSEQNAAGSEERAKGYADNAGQSASDAADSAQAAEDSQNAAEKSEQAAAQHEQNTSASEERAKGYADAAGKSASAADTSAQAAGKSATDAQASKQAAAESAKAIEDYSRVAESWAVGGTDTREGEDTDNSKYYSGLSKASAEQAAIEAEKAAKYSAITAPNFMIDLEDMQLYMKDGVGVDFKLDDGALYWQLT